MTFWEAVFLGVIQGVFMFFPVSSTSHLVLAQHWLLERGATFPAPDSPEMIAFVLVVHVGTLVSIGVVFRKSLRDFCRKVLQDISTRAPGKTEPRSTLFLRLTALGLISVAVTGVVGWPLKPVLEQTFAHPLFISGALAATGVMLWITDTLGPRKRGLRQLTLTVAVVIGLAQAAALIPGISRSGATIVAALLLGLKRRWAAEYSFFIAIPTILAATLVHGLEIYQYAGLVGLAGLNWTALVTGFVVAAGVGILALYLVVTLLYRARFRYFSYYVWALAVLTAFAVFTGQL
mgnify:CR=1 FL=1|jgi:undecaprenyl-diphosphatase